jgi:hypothetical protein
MVASIQRSADAGLPGGLPAQPVRRLHYGADRHFSDGIGSDLYMNIKLTGQITGIGVDDLGDVDHALYRIGDACAQLCDELTQKMIAAAEAHEQYCARILQLCHTGK